MQTREWDVLEDRRLGSFWEKVFGGGQFVAHTKQDSPVAGHEHCPRPSEKSLKSSQPSYGQD